MYSHTSEIIIATYPSAPVRDLTPEYFNELALQFKDDLTGLHAAISNNIAARNQHHRAPIEEAEKLRAAIKAHAVFGRSDVGQLIDDKKRIVGLYFAAPLSYEGQIDEYLQQGKALVAALYGDAGRLDVFEQSSAMRFRILYEESLGRRSGAGHEKSGYDIG